MQLSEDFLSPIPAWFPLPTEPPRDAEVAPIMRREDMTPAALREYVLTHPSTPMLEWTPARTLSESDSILDAMVATALWEPSDLDYFLSHLDASGATVGRVFQHFVKSNHIKAVYQLMLALDRVIPAQEDAPATYTLSTARRIISMLPGRDFMVLLVNRNNLIPEDVDVIGYLLAYSISCWLQEAEWMLTLLGVAYGRPLLAVAVGRYAAEKNDPSLMVVALGLYDFSPSPTANKANNASWDALLLEAMEHGSINTVNYMKWRVREEGQGPEGFFLS